MPDTFGGDLEFQQQLETRIKQLNKTEGKEGTMAKTVAVLPEILPTQPQKDADSPKEHQVASENARPSGRKDSKYYQSHREEILADLDSIGRKKTEQKWSLSRRSMGQLIKSRKAKSEPEKSPSATPVDKSEHESTEIDKQVEWLQTYKELAGEFMATKRQCAAGVKQED